MTPLTPEGPNDWVAFDGHTAPSLSALELTRPGQGRASEETVRERLWWLHRPRRSLALRDAGHSLSSTFRGIEGAPPTA